MPSSRSSNSNDQEPETGTLGPVARAVSLDPALYLVAMPIGNARDITLRALDTLAAADVVACEDTRTSGLFLRNLGIKARLTAYHDHNAARAIPKLMETLKGGGSVALITDAGTPLVSDPGYRLAQACIADGIAIVPVPGPSAVLAGLSLAALPTDRFYFHGFLPPKQGARQRAMQGLKSIPATLVFFESAKRLAGSLADMADALGDRPAAVTRELTKKFEEAQRGTLQNLAAHYDREGPPKGEIVIVVGPPGAGEAEPTEAELDQMIRQALDRGGTVKDVVQEITAATGLGRKDVYARALALKDASGA